MKHRQVELGHRFPVTWRQLVAVYCYRMCANDLGDDMHARYNPSCSRAGLPPLPPGAGQPMHFELTVDIPKLLRVRGKSMGLIIIRTD
eukprot:COSAG01_NODE_5859_length_3987_cov_80.637088_7_plen_88_part_00